MAVRQPWGSSSIRQGKKTTRRRSSWRALGKVACSNEGQWSHGWRYVLSASGSERFPSGRVKKNAVPVPRLGALRAFGVHGVLDRGPRLRDTGWSLAVHVHFPAFGRRLTGSSNSCLRPRGQGLLRAGSLSSWASGEAATSARSTSWSLWSMRSCAGLRAITSTGSGSGRPWRRET